MRPAATWIAAVTKLLAFALVVGAAAPHAWAKGKDGDGDDVEVEDDDQPAKPAKKAARKPSGDDPGGSALQKQDLSGHDLGTTKKENVFERDRFFVDKVDTAKTETGTLIQGSITSTTFGYHESGGTIAPTGAGVPSASQFNRLFTDLRLQTDFRHIAGSRWEVRIDVRGRLVTGPGVVTLGFTPATNSTVQSGFLGQNELELKELGNLSGRWDADRLAQVVTNLVGNAVKHGIGGTPIVIEVDGTDASVVRLAVRNAGRIPP